MPQLKLAPLGLRFPWIDDRNAGAHKRSRVASRNGESMHGRNRCDLAVANGNGTPACAHTAEECGIRDSRRLIKCQDARSEQFPKKLCQCSAKTFFAPAGR